MSVVYRSVNGVIAEASTASVLEPESHVVLQNVEAKPHLNGVLAIARKHLQDRDAWKLAFPGRESEPLAAKADKLKVVDRSTFVHVPDGGRLAGAKIPLYCTFGKDGLGGLGIRLHYADFLGAGALEALEAREPGLGPYAVHHQYGMATDPAHEGGPRDGQECVFAVSKHGADLLRDMVRFGVVRDTGRKASLGYHKDCRVLRVPFAVEHVCNAPPRDPADASGGVRVTHVL